MDSSISYNLQDKTKEELQEIISITNSASSNLRQIEYADDPHKLRQVEAEITKIHNRLKELHSSISNAPIFGLPEANIHQHTDISNNPTSLKLRFLQTFLELKRQKREKDNLQAQIDYLRLHTLEHFQIIFSKAALPPALKNEQAIKEVAEDKITDATIRSIEQTLCTKAVSDRKKGHVDRRERILHKIDNDKNWQVDTEGFLKNVFNRDYYDPEDPFAYPPWVSKKLKETDNV